MTEAWCGDQALVCVEGVRVLQLEGCILSVISVFPDDTAYVTTRKTFPKAVIEAARQKWGTPSPQQQWQGTMEDHYMAALMGMTLQDYLRHKRR